MTFLKRHTANQSLQVSYVYTQWIRLYLQFPTALTVACEMFEQNIDSSRVYKAITQYSCSLVKFGQWATSIHLFLFQFHQRKKTSKAVDQLL